jgi:uncharacterized protein (DUF305 family)
VIVTIRRAVATVGRLIVTGLAVSGLATGATACGGAPVRVADAHWAAMMVPHHEAGIALDDAALRRTDDVRVRHLAFEMNSYQGRELDDLRALAAHATGPPMAPTGMPTAAELADLESRRGEAFDLAFLTLMIRHHEGAVTMAERDGHAGTSAGVRRLADGVAAVQRDQLARMRALLSELG